MMSLSLLAGRTVPMKKLIIVIKVADFKAAADKSFSSDDANMY